MDNVDIAWAAGLFEGEGCAGIWKHPHSPSPLIRLQLSMTDADVVERFCRIVQCGKVGPERLLRQLKLDGTPRKTVYVWVISNRPDVERILRMFLPYLGERRTAKANEVLAEIARWNRECQLCGAPFRARRVDALFCCWQHRNRWHYLKNRPVEASKMGRPRLIA